MTKERTIILRRTPTLDTDAQPPQSWDSKVIMLAGAIRAWWDEGWDTPEHWQYVEWRNSVNTALVDAGYLVYRPHEAFKGTWNEKAQMVNDAAIEISDVMLVLSPEGVPTEGTDAEVDYAINHNTMVFYAPQEYWTTDQILGSLRDHFSVRNY